MSTQRLQEDATPEGIPAWRELFKNKSQMDSSPMKFPISDFLPEGITFIGGLSGSGKTFFCLSMAKAICTGEKFLGNFAITEQSAVLYLIPESGERAFRQRMEIMEIPDDERFLCRTMTDEPIKLSNPDLLIAVQELKPVIFLDTVVRFNEGENESDASQTSRHLAEKVHALWRAGAKAVVCLHHSPKDSANKPVTLENTLRGSGDLGAMADAVYSLKVEDHGSLRIRVQNVKARDFEPVPPFVIQGRPFIDETANFGMIVDIQQPKYSKEHKDRQQQFVSIVTANPTATFRELESQLKTNRGGIQRMATKFGWTKAGGDTWVRVAVEPEGMHLVA